VNSGRWTLRKVYYYDGEANAKAAVDRCHATIKQSQDARKDSDQAKGEEHCAAAHSIFLHARTENHTCARLM
jgi:hypothetical protein